MKISFFSLMFLMFLGLQLSGCIAWPWIWIFAPLWIPLCLVVLMFATAGIIAAIAIKSETKVAANGR